MGPSSENPIPKATHSKEMNDTVRRILLDTTTAKWGVDTDPLKCAEDTKTGAISTSSVGNTQSTSTTSMDRDMKDIPLALPNTIAVSMNIRKGERILSF